MIITILIDLINIMLSIFARILETVHLRIILFGQGGREVDEGPADGIGVALPGASGQVGSVAARVPNALYSSSEPGASRIAHC